MTEVPLLTSSVLLYIRLFRPTWPLVSWSLQSQPPASVSRGLLSQLGSSEVIIGLRPSPLVSRELHIQTVVDNKEHFDDRTSKWHSGPGVLYLGPNSEGWLCLS